MNAAPRPYTEEVQGKLLRISAYDRAAAWLLALLVVGGAGIFFLAAAWLQSALSDTAFAAPPVIESRAVQRDGGITDGTVGESMTLLSPEWHDVAAESNLTQVSELEPLAAITAKLSDDPDKTSAISFADLRDPEILGTRLSGDGARPARGSGPGRPGLPPQVRWTVRFPHGCTLTEYARQLEFFQIELGVLGGDDRVTLVRGLSQPTPVKEVKPRLEMRDTLFMRWRKGSDQIVADRELALAAGVDVQGAELVQFYPRRLEDMLLQLEEEFSSADLARVKETIFELYPDGDGYAFRVVKQVVLPYGARPGAWR